MGLRLHLEDIVAKRADSPYEDRRREEGISNDRVTVKTQTISESYMVTPAGVRLYERMHPSKQRAAEATCIVVVIPFAIHRAPLAFDSHVFLRPRIAS